jgi:hypothetical protein
MTLYRKPKNSTAVGDLKVKSWQTLPGLDIAPDDPLWAARCQQYWELQARLFGWRMSAYTFSYTTITEGGETKGFVSTYCAILEILPGERTEVWERVPVQSAQIGSLQN